MVLIAFSCKFTYIQRKNKFELFLLAGLLLAVRKHRLKICLPDPQISSIWKKSLFLSWPLSSKAALGPLGAQSSLLTALTASHGPFRKGRDSIADGTARRPLPCSPRSCNCGWGRSLCSSNGDSGAGACLWKFLVVNIRRPLSLSKGMDVSTAGQPISRWN